MLILAGSTSISVDVQVVDDAGLAVTGLVAATLPAISYSLNNNTAAVSISLSDLAAITTAYASGGVKERSVGWYRLDLPAGALTAAGRVTIIGDASGKHLLCRPIDVTHAKRGTMGTAAPDADAGAANGLLISGTNAGTTTLAALTVTGAFSINGTSNVAQTGDSFARIGAAGAGLTALGDTRLANLDTTVGSRGTSNFSGGAVQSVSDPVTLAPNQDVRKVATIEAGGINEDAITAGAVTKIQAGLSTAAALAALAAKFTGITLLAQWLGLIAGKQTGNSTARTELRATGAGSGTFDETRHSTEALRDRGDAAWTSGTGGDATAANQAKILKVLKAQTSEG